MYTLAVRYVIVLIFALCGAPVCSAKCGTLLRGIKWNSRTKGPYNQGDLATDFSPYNFFRGSENCKLTGEGLEVNVKKGCHGTKKGCGLYGRAPLIKSVTSATLEFTMEFPENFDWVRGGKLPGLCAGECPTGCQNSVKSKDGFSARVMWTDLADRGGMHAYAYYSNMKHSQVCGDEIPFARGGLRFGPRPGRTYSIRLVVNTKIGYIKTYVNGYLVGYRKNMRLTSSKKGIQYLMFESFFGGSKRDAARKHEKLLFKSLYVWEGDCGGRAGTRSRKNIFLEASDKAPKKSKGGAKGRVPWSAHSIDKRQYGNRGGMKTEAVEVQTIFNGGFCAKFRNANRGKTACNKMAVEINMNPALLKLQKHTKSLRKSTSSQKKGYYLFRASKKFKSQGLKPGASRKGMFCAVTLQKMLLTKAQIQSAFTVNTLCEVNPRKLQKV